MPRVSDARLATALVVWKARREVNTGQTLNFSSVWEGWSFGHLLVPAAGQSYSILRASIRGSEILIRSCGFRLRCADDHGHRRSGSCSRSDWWCDISIANR
jgi:hypothetical protein